MKVDKLFSALLSAGLAALLVLSLSPGLNGQSGSDASRLLGKWSGRTEFGQLVLEFRSATQLVFEGDVVSYKLLPGIIRIEDEDGTTDYRYAFRGDTLVVSFPEGIQVEFTRLGAPPKPLPAPLAGTKPGRSEPTPSAAGRGAEIGAPGIASSPQIGAGEAGDAGWGFKFQPPAGWKFQSSPEGIFLGHDTVAGMILVLPHTAANIQAVREQMMLGLHEEGLDLTPAGGLRPAGASALAGDYEGVVQGGQAKALGLGTLSPFGGGAFIVALTTPEKFGRELPAAAETIARNMRYFRVEASEVMSHFAGTWVTMTKSTETRFTLTPAGEFYSGYEASYSGRFDDGGAWGTASNSSDRGRWTVRGDKRQGQIILTYSNGRQVQIPYRVQVERGETFWNEYWFNGDLYGRRR